MTSHPMKSKDFQNQSLWCLGEEEILDRYNPGDIKETSPNISLSSTCCVKIKRRFRLIGAQVEGGRGVLLLDPSMDWLACRYRHLMLGKLAPFLKIGDSKHNPSSDSIKSKSFFEIHDHRYEREIMTFLFISALLAVILVMSD